MNTQQLEIAVKTAKIIKRKFDAGRVYVLDNSDGQVSDRKQSFVLATEAEFSRHEYIGCEEFIARVV